MIADQRYRQSDAVYLTETTEKFVPPPRDDVRIKASRTAGSSVTQIMPSQRYDSVASQLTIGNFQKYVSKTLRMHLHFAAADEAWRHPPLSVVNHLVEYVVRTAVSQLWDFGDLDGCAKRVQRMMWTEHSELVEMAELYGLVFVQKVPADVEETVLLSTDIASADEQATSEEPEELPEQPSFTEDMAGQYSISVSSPNRLLCAV